MKRLLMFCLTLTISLTLFAGMALAANIEIVTFEQSKKGKYAEVNQKAKEEIPAQILAKQSLVVDSVAKASASSMGIELAVAEALEKATVKYKDGKYTGSAKGYNKKKQPGSIVVEVTVAGGKISAIDLVTFKQSEKGKYAEVNKVAKEQIPTQIIAKQSTAVDSVAKASMSSDGIKLAVARALEQAR